MPRLQRSADEELGDAVPQGWFSFSKQTPNRWALFSLWLCGVDGIEVMERRHFTRVFTWVIFSLQGLKFSMKRRMQRLAQDSSQCSPASGLWEQHPRAAVHPKTQHRTPAPGKQHEAAGRGRAGFVHHQFYPLWLFSATTETGEGLIGQGQWL